METRDSGESNGDKQLMFPTYKMITKQDRFAEIKKEVGEEANRLVERWTDAAVDLMRQTCPVRTGDLRDSIEPFDIPAAEAFGQNKAIRIGMYYWPFVNYGTVFQEAQPFVEPALQAAFDGMIREAHEILAARG